MTLNGEPRTIVGVLAKGFEVPDQSELWVSTIHELPVLPGFLDGLTVRDASYLRAVARLKPGITLARAQAELDAISSRLTKDYPDSNQGHLLRAATLQSTIVGDAREPLLLLLGGVVLVLLIACANVSGLQLARGAAGERDLAVRAALGASRWQLVRQLLIESTVLALFGGALGVVASWWGVKLLVALAGPSLPRSAEVTIDGTVLAFAAGLSMLSGIASGLLPALLASRPRSIAALRTGAMAAAPAHARLRGALVTVEVALAFMLLTGAALLVRSFERLRDVDPGFHAEGVIVLPVSHEEQGAAQFHAELARRVSALAGVHAAGSVFRLPMARSSMTGDITPEGRPPRAGDYMAATQIVAGDYFHAMGIPLLAGRALTAADTKTSARVAVVNQAFARRFFPGADALGKRFCYGVADAHTTEWFTVVGVAADVRQASLAQAAQPEAYYPLEQAPAPPVEMTLVARTDLGFAAFLHALQGELEADQPLTRARTLEETVSTTLQRRRLSMILLAAFSGCALLLA
ncbi:MAG TPA: ABC transporter permease, partial [Myxococcales bacterium]|nr:ABC transporter permease [Myxococcales bacterium]